MRGTAMLVAGTVALAMLVADSAASSSATTRSSRADAMVSGKRPTCKTNCKAGRGRGQGPDGVAICGPPSLLDYRSAPAGRALTLTNDLSENYFVTAGDVVVAAILSQGATITPPAGWKPVPRLNIPNGAGQRLQVFYAIPLALSTLGTVDPREVPVKYSFTASSPQTLSGALTVISGADQAQPINASNGAANSTSSNKVKAPSITPSAAAARLLFIGATGSTVDWTTPAGMTPVETSGGGASDTTRIRLAYGWSRAGTATGVRTATIGSSAASIGAQIALKVPTPTKCPTIRILNPRNGSNVRYQADADGVISVKLQCTWSKPCVGGLTLNIPLPVAAGDISVPAGTTKTVSIGVCGHAVTCTEVFPVPKGASDVLAMVLLRAPNGQLVEATDRRDSDGTLTIP